MLRFFRLALSKIQHPSLLKKENILLMLATLK